MEELGRLDNLTVTMLGDLKYGRTVHSLARLLSQFSNIKLNYVSPDILKMPKEVMDEVAAEERAAGGILVTRKSAARN